MNGPFSSTQCLKPENVFCARFPPCHGSQEPLQKPEDLKDDKDEDDPPRRPAGTQGTQGATGLAVSGATTPVVTAKSAPSPRPQTGWDGGFLG